MEEELECRCMAVSSEGRLGMGFRFGDGGRVGMDAIWVNVRAFGLAFDSLLVCNAYLSRFARFWLLERCEDPRPVIDIAVDREPC